MITFTNKVKMTLSARFNLDSSGSQWQQHIVINQLRRAPAMSVQKKSTGLTQCEMKTLKTFKIKA